MDPRKVINAVVQTQSPYGSSSGLSFVTVTFNKRTLICKMNVCEVPISTILQSAFLLWNLNHSS